MMQMIVIFFFFPCHLHPRYYTELLVHQTKKGSERYRLHIKDISSPSRPVHYDPDIIHITRDKERSEQYTCTYSV